MQTENVFEKEAKLANLKKIPFDTCTISFDLMKSQIDRSVKRVMSCVTRDLDTATDLRKDFRKSAVDLLEELEGYQSRADNCVKNINDDSGIFSVSYASVCVESVSWLLIINIITIKYFNINDLIYFKFKF